MMFRSMIVGAAVVLLMGCPRTTPKPDAGCVGITCPTGGGAPGGGGGGTSGGGSGGGAQGGGTGGSQGGGTGGSQGGGTGGSQGGGTGGSQGGGTGGGTGGGNSMPMTIAEARTASFPAIVNLQGVVVTAVSFARVSAASTNCAHLAEDGGMSKGVNASFWVADPSNSQNGIWVDKFRCDGDVDYFPRVGDVLNISGVVGFESSFTQQEGSRIRIASEFDYIPSKPTGYVCELSSTPPCEPLSIHQTGTMAPLPVVNVPITFGSNGVGPNNTIQSDRAFAGARVKIAGPLTIGNIDPIELKRISALPNDTRYFGFGLSNNVLVNNFRTFEGATLEDGGVSHCDIRYIVGDGGTVTFPNGIAGVWDSYTHATCTDGGTSLTSCFNNRGIVPGTDAGFYTYVLYPTDCADYTP